MGVIINKTALIVLGMHRSGTSALAGTFSMLGATHPATLSPEDQYNERGYWESRQIWRFNDELLAFMGSAWDDWRPLNPDLSEPPATESFTQRAREIMQEEFGAAAVIVLKDPRLCRLTRFWFNVLDELGYDKKIVVPLRDPMEVALSLAGRNGFPLFKGLLLWLRYMLDTEAATRAVPRSIVGWPDFLNDWRGATNKISQNLDLSWPRLTDESAAEIDGFLTTDLRHHKSEEAALDTHPEVHEWVVTAYRTLKELALQPGSVQALSTLDNLRVTLDQSCRLLSLAGYERMIEEIRVQNQQIQELRQAIESKDRESAEFLQQIHSLQETLRARDQLIAEKDSGESPVKHMIANTIPNSEG